MEFNFEISGDKIGLLLQLPPIYRKHQSFQETKVVTFRNRPTTSDGFPHQSEIHARSLETSSNPQIVEFVRKWSMDRWWRCMYFFSGIGDEGDLGAIGTVIFWK